MNKTEFSARVLAMRAEKPPRLTIGRFKHLSWRSAPTPAERAAINRYLSQFMVPVLKGETLPVVSCPCCGAHLFTGSEAIDAIKSQFQGGMGAGEGYCDRCVYPIKFVHTLPGDRSLSYPLAYHPDIVRADVSLSIGPREIAERINRRKVYAGQKWIM
jgi:hypothetical protein